LDHAAAFCALADFDSCKAKAFPREPRRSHSHPHDPSRRTRLFDGQRAGENLERQLIEGLDQLRARNTLRVDSGCGRPWYSACCTPGGSMKPFVTSMTILRSCPTSPAPPRRRPWKRPLRPRRGVDTGFDGALAPHSRSTKRSKPITKRLKLRAGRGSGRCGTPDRASSLLRWPQGSLGQIYF
jgi:hypothetical protein